MRCSWASRPTTATGSRRGRRGAGTSSTTGGWARDRVTFVNFTAGGLDPVERARVQPEQRLLGEHRQLRRGGGLQNATPFYLETPHRRQGRRQGGRVPRPRRRGDRQRGAYVVANSPFLVTGGCSERPGLECLGLPQSLRRPQPPERRRDGGAADPVRDDAAALTLVGVPDDPTTPSRRWCRGAATRYSSPERCRSGRELTEPHAGGRVGTGDVALSSGDVSGGPRLQHLPAAAARRDLAELDAERRRPLLVRHAEPGMLHLKLVTRRGRTSTTCRSSRSNCGRGDRRRRLTRSVPPPSAPGQADTRRRLRAPARPPQHHRRVGLPGQPWRASARPPASEGSLLSAARTRNRPIIPNTTPRAISPTCAARSSARRTCASVVCVGSTPRPRTPLTTCATPYPATPRPTIPTSHWPNGAAISSAVR